MKNFPSPLQQEVYILGSSWITNAAYAFFMWLFVCVCVCIGDRHCWVGNRLRGSGTKAARSPIFGLFSAHVKAGNDLPSWRSWGVCGGGGCLPTSALQDSGTPSPQRLVDFSVTERGQFGQRLPSPGDDVSWTAKV